MKQLFIHIWIIAFCALTALSESVPNLPIRVKILDPTPDGKRVAELSVDQEYVHDGLVVIFTYAVEQDGRVGAVYGGGSSGGAFVNKSRKCRRDNIPECLAAKPPCKIVGALVEVFEKDKLVGEGATSPEMRDIIISDRAAPTTAEARKAARLTPVAGVKRTVNATDQPVSDQSGSVILIKTDHGQGTGFVCSMAGTNYIVTNAHVLEGAKEFEFRTLQNTLLRPLRLEIANDRDLARLVITNDLVTHLDIAAKDPALGQKISVFGNSLGMGAVTYLPGIIRAVGANVIEVDAQFVSGNSGSPVVLNNNQAIGVATYVVKPGMTNWVTAGTPFAEARRFAVRLQGNIDWKRVSVRKFYEEGALLQDSDRVLAETWAIAKILRANRLNLLSEVAARQKGAESRFHDPALARSIASVCDNIAAANAAYKKLSNENSSSVQLPLRSAKMTFQQLPVGLLQQIQSTKWTTSYHREQAQEYEKIFKDWK